MFVPNRWVRVLSQLIRNETTLGFSFLVENSGIDLSNTEQFFLKNNQFKLLNLSVFYTFYFYGLKERLTIFTESGPGTMHTLKSIDSIFKNAN